MRGRMCRYRVSSEHPVFLLITQTERTLGAARRVLLHVRIRCVVPCVTTWFKVPLEITRSGLGADQLRGVIKHHKGTITVEFDLSRPLFLD